MTHETHDNAPPPPAKNSAHNDNAPRPAGRRAAFAKKLCIILTAGMTIVANPLNARDAGDDLDKRQRRLAAIASNTALGNLVRLESEINGALDEGLTVNEAKETLVHSYAYCGFPRSIRGLQTLMAVVDARKAKGVAVDHGRDASPITARGEKYTRGKKILETLSGRAEPAPPRGFNAFSPEIDRFLKEHLFADIFERDVLSYKDRELATVSIIAAIGGAEPMLNSHLGLALNAGLTPGQLTQAVGLLAAGIGKEKTGAAKAVLNSVLKSRGLPVADAATTTIENGVSVQKVSFPNRININVAGDLYFPPDYKTDARHAAIIVGHTFTGVKEQTAGLHARRMAELGYVTLAFDASFWGESGGEPRNIEVPEIRVEDFSAAVDFLSNHPSVDKDRIGVIGICGGGCYAVSAAAIDHRIKAVATVSMYDLGRARRQALGDVVTYQQRMATLDEIGRQRTREFAGAPRRDNLGVPDKLSPSDTENTREFFDYYRTPRGRHPHTSTNYSFTSVAPMMNFFPFAQIETISPRPLLFIVGGRAVSAYFSEDAFARAAEPKELFVVPSASHVDLYDRAEHMKITLSKLNGFFQRHLIQSGLNNREMAEHMTEWPESKKLAAKAGIEIKDAHLADSTIFPLGEPVNPQWFAGKAWLQMLSTSNALNTRVANVTFAPGARNHWHSHKAGQILLVTGGEGFYQEWGRPAQKLKTGDVVNINANIKHWHGATAGSWFAHLAINSGESEWFEPVDEKEYNNASQK